MNKKSGRRESAVSTVIFASSVVVLVIIAGVGFGLYGMGLSSHNAMTETVSGSTVTVTTTGQGMTETTTASGMTESMTTAEMMNQTNAYMFKPGTGAMVNNAWLLSVPVGMHEYGE